MKGLILKEFLGLRQYFKMLGLLLILYAVMAFMMRTTVLIALFNTFLIMISVFNSFHDGGSSRWERLALTFPVSRSDLVRSKYLFILLLCLASMVVTLALSLALGLLAPVSPGAMLTGAAVSFLGGLFLSSLFTPILYRFGLERARVIMVFAIMVPSLILRIFADRLNALFPLSAQALTLFGLGSAALVLVFSLASYGISQRIFAAREF